MDLILKQLGGLIVGSVPTMIMFVLLVVAYGLLVRRPLDRVLAERRARTSGAIEQARGAMSAAEAETAVFEDKLRSAKNEIFQRREQRLKQWNTERERSLSEARQITVERVRGAKLELEQSVAASRVQIESLSGELSTRILQAVLPPGVGASEVSQ